MPRSDFLMPDHVKKKAAVYDQPPFPVWHIIAPIGIFVQKIMGK